MFFCQKKLNWVMFFTVSRSVHLFRQYGNVGLLGIKDNRNTTHMHVASTGQLIMVIGGKADRGGWSDDIELISPDPNTTPVPSCLSDLNSFPLGHIHYGAGGLITSSMSTKR